MSTLSASRGPAPSGPRGTGARTRFLILAQVASGVLLAAAAAALATWLAGRPGLRWRLDLTRAGRNTLDPALAEVVRRLPAPVTLEVFFRPPQGPLEEVLADAQGRMRELLFVARAQFPGQLAVVNHDLSDLSAASAARTRMRELELEELDVVAAVAGEASAPRKAVLKLLRDIARVDLGNPLQRVPPRLESFRGEEALASALLRVSRAGTPRVLFATGHGERDPFGEHERGLAALHGALVSDGFEVALWDGSREPQVPASCAVLALVDPTRPYSPSELEAAHAYLARGGRVLAVPSSSDRAYDGPGSLAELLRRCGLEPQAGHVAQFARNAAGELVDGLRECASLAVAPEGIDKRHAITESLWRARIVLPVPLSRAFERGTVPPGGVALDLLRSARQSWLDLPDGAGRHDWRLDEKLEDGRGHFALAYALTLPPSAPAGERAGEPGHARLVALGSAEVLSAEHLRYARDFVLNAFNWLAEREERIHVTPRAAEPVRLDLRNTPALSTAFWICAVGLPALCAALGALLAVLRRR